MVHQLGAYHKFHWSLHQSDKDMLLHFHIHSLLSIRWSPTVKFLHNFELELTYLDYCNGLLSVRHQSKCLLSSLLTGVRQATARLILLLPRQSSLTDWKCGKLYWLGIPLIILVTIADLWDHGLFSFEWKLFSRYTKCFPFNTSYFNFLSRFVCSYCYQNYCIQFKIFFKGPIWWIVTSACNYCCIHGPSSLGKSRWIKVEYLFFLIYLSS